MATDVIVYLRGGRQQAVHFADDEFEFKDTEHVVLLLGSGRRVRYAANLTDFVDLAVLGGEGASDDGE